MSTTGPPLATKDDGLLARAIGFCLENKLVVLLGTVLLVASGLYVAPFDWHLGGLPRSPVPVDAIPDVGENQQIVFTQWPGRSPQDVEDQITYPLSSALLGVPGVKTVRSLSMFGFSNIYLIFEDDAEFYWSRTRTLEKLNALPPGLLPGGVRPTLGPDATPLGQVFWYTLEGRDPDGRPTGGWDLHELRSIQDWQVRYELMAVPGVAEVASVGGFVQEYQVDVDPDAMRAHGVALEQVVNALRRSNIDVGARTLEVNRVEYVIRGLGLVRSLTDLEAAVVTVSDNVPIRVRDVARVVLGPALRRGALDKGGAEAVGGVVVVRYGANPLEVIKRVKAKLAQIQTSLPERTVQVRQPDGTTRPVESRVAVVPFYDRTGLIQETLGTLSRALTDEVMVTIIVVAVMLVHLRSSLLISSLLPLAILLCFGAMRVFGVDANVVALSGIAIAIGTMVDMGIVLNENILRQLEEAGGADPRIRERSRAACEVGGAVVAGGSTTVVSFLPVFTMGAAEGGKLFKPLAYTKTFALAASLLVALTLLPAAAHVVLARRRAGGAWRRAAYPAALVVGAVLAVALRSWWLVGGVLVLVAVYRLVRERLSGRARRAAALLTNWLVVAGVVYLLARHWTPLGVGQSLRANLTFVAMAIGGLLLFFYLFYRAYERILRWCLRHKVAFLAVPTALCVFGLTIWLGFDRVFGLVPRAASGLGVGEGRIRAWGPWVWAAHAFPGLGKEFMPALDEGSFLLMPTTAPHASIGEAMGVLRQQDMAISAIPEVLSAVGKIGRAESPLDPAPISMIETVINYKGEYLADRDGKPLTFRLDPDATDLFRDEDATPLPAPDGGPYKVRGEFARGEHGKLIRDPGGQPFRLWRPALDPTLNPGRKAWPGIRRLDDIWNEIVRAAKVPGTTSAPKLQPIATRLVMLQSGMRAAMGLKVFGKGKADLQALEDFAVEVEGLLRQVPMVNSDTVNAERIVGKPYIELDIDREAISRHGVSVEQALAVLQTAVGGRPVTTTVEGRKRYRVRVRYLRELRSTIEDVERILVPAAGGAQIPLKQLLLGRQARYRRGPTVIKSEDGDLVAYDTFDKRPGSAEVDVVRQAEAFLKAKIEARELTLPEGISYRFAGSFEQQAASEKRLMVVLPLALFIIFLILYLHFRRVSTMVLVFSGVAVAWAGGFIMIWLYGRPWFLDFAVSGVNLRELFQVHPINLSVAIWVGFLALFGIATDDGVVMATYLDQSFAAKRPATAAAVREAAVAAATRRVRPCLMTTATTLLALVPVLTSTGRGSDIMVPMAIPTFGGMAIELITMFVVPTLYCFVAETRLRFATPVSRTGSPVELP